jgi:hypothetical protein
MNRSSHGPSDLLQRHDHHGRSPATIFLCLLGALALTGCGTYSKVSEKRPSFLPNPIGRGVLAGAEAEITKALHHERSRPIDALDDYLEAARKK